MKRTINLFELLPTHIIDKDEYYVEIAFSTYKPKYLQVITKIRKKWK